MTSLSRIVTSGPSGPRIAQFNAIVSNDFEQAYARASVRKELRKFGHNGNIATGTSEDIWHGSTAFYSGWLQAAQPLRIRAGGNANDSANGTGAREVTLHPLDANFDWHDDDSIVLSTNGASASAPTSQSFIRCIRAFVSKSGQYANGSTSGTNAGVITIETTGGIEVAAIDTDDGQAEMSMFTVPRAFTLWLDRVSISVDSNQPAEVQFFQRQNANVVTAPFTARRSVVTLTGVSGPTELSFDYLVPFPEKTDLWWRATAGANNTAVAVQYTGLLLSNE